MSSKKTNGIKTVINHILIIIAGILIALCIGTKADGQYAVKTDISISSAPADDRHKTLSPDYEAGVLTVYAVDVGQGDAFLLVSPNGKTMMIDSGYAETQDKVEKFIESKGISTLDLVVATHPHADHIGAFPYLFDKFSVGKLLMPDARTAAAAYRNLMQSVKKHNIDYYAAWRGDTIEWDKDCAVTILGPVEGIEYSSEDMNDWSIIMRVEYKDNSMIFTGDAEAGSEQKALLFNEKELFKADVLKVCHHGSAYSSTQGFLDAVSPKYAIISVGKDNNYGHPDFSTLFKLEMMDISIYRTDIHGNITIALDGENVKITTEKTGN